MTAGLVTGDEAWRAASSVRTKTSRAVRGSLLATAVQVRAIQVPAFQGEDTP